MAIHLWVIVGEDINTGVHSPYLLTFATKKEAQQEAKQRNRCNTIPRSFCFNKFFRVVKYVPVWDLAK